MTSTFEDMLSLAVVIEKNWKLDGWFLEVSPQSFCSLSQIILYEKST